jgi:hypothetical protein
MAQTASRKRKTNVTKQASQDPLVSTQDLNISEEEQWRLINETGILRNLPPDSGNYKQAQQDTKSEDEDTPLAEEIFMATVLIIPFSFMLLMMDILVNRQYGKEATFRDLADRLVPGIPSTFVLPAQKQIPDKRSIVNIHILQ